MKLSHLNEYADGKILAGVVEATGHIVINNPERHNAVSKDMYEAAAEQVQKMATDDNVRLLMLRGAGGKAFASGADISKFEKERNSEEQVAAYQAATARFYASVFNFPKPTIAYIQGYCIGGGLGLALACDLRLARDDASFAIPAARLGLAYPASATERLRDTIGRARAKDILFTARRLDAHEALTIGLVDYVAPTADFETELAQRVASICANAPLTLRAAKAVLEGTPDADQAELDRKIAACFASADYEEGRLAFMEKRTPEFKGK